MDKRTAKAVVGKLDQSIVALCEAINLCPVNSTQGRILENIKGKIWQEMQDINDEFYPLYE